MCVFCGSAIGARASYGEAAHQIGQDLAHHGLTLIYGGGSTGLMGLVADSALRHGGDVIGIMPQALKDREIDHRGLTQMIIVNSMHERKAKMAELADAFVALAGGFGTYEELFEIITWAQLGIHSKPIVLLNTDGYYDALLQMIRHSVDEGFIRTIDHTILRVAEQSHAVIPLLNTKMSPEFRPKWLILDQT